MQTSARTITYDFEIEISDQADADLRGIYEYIAFELQSPENAAGQLDRLEESITGLEQMPERFREYENEPWHSWGLRIMSVGNYGSADKRNLSQGTEHFYRGER